MGIQSFIRPVLGIVIVVILLEIVSVVLKPRDIRAVHAVHGDVTKDQRRPYAVQNVTAHHTGTLLRPLQPIPTNDTLYLSHKALPRALTLKQFNLSITLLEAVTSLLTRNNISFIMAQGTLMGSYFFHSVIPWDDDMDLFVDILDINKLRTIFRTKQFQRTFEVSSFHEPEGIEMWGGDTLREDIHLNNTRSCGKRNPNKTCHQQLKVYFRSSPQIGNYKWKYPFVDIFFTYRNGSYVYNHENHNLVKVIKVHVDDFYPLVLRPIHHLWLPAPNNTKAFLQVVYNKFVCKRSIWDHQKETYFKGTAVYPCEKLTGYYPYVRRRPYISPQGTRLKGQVLEDLMLKDKVIRTVIVNQTYYTSDVLKLQ